MPNVTYEIELDRDVDRGLDRYTITVADGFDVADACELGDWMTAAAQNPTAVFRIDVSDAPRTARRPLTRLFARLRRLSVRERVEVVRRRLGAPLAIGGVDLLTGLML